MRYVGFGCYGRLFEGLVEVVVGFVFVLGDFYIVVYFVLGYVFFGYFFFS